MIFGAAILLTVAFAAPARSASTSADAKLAAVGRIFFKGSWAFRPAEATNAGVHDYDSQLGGVTPAAFSAEIARLRSTLYAVRAIDADDLSLDAKADRHLLQSDIGRKLFNLETRPEWRISPSYYVQLGSSSVFSIVSRDFAPLRDRMALVIARERQIPAMLEQGRSNVEPSRVPAIYAQTAILDANGAADFLERDVATAFAPVSDADLQTRFAQSNAAAATAYRRYADFIKTSVVPEAHASFAIGAAAYEHLETLQNVNDIPLSRLLSVGEANLAKDKAAFIATAREIDPIQSNAIFE